MKLTVLVLALMLLQSCSSMFNSGSQSVRVQVDKEYGGINAVIMTPSGSYDAKLPTTIVTSPSTFKHVEIKIVDKCYQETMFKAERGVTPSFWANIFNGGLGFLIDPFTGAMWKYDDNFKVIPQKIADCK